MPDPTVAALRDVLTESLEEIEQALAGLTLDELNARPAGEGTNSLAVISAHVIGSTHSWCALAMGSPLPPRDRPAEFETVAGDGFVADVHEAFEQILALFGDDATFDPAREGVAAWMATSPDEPVTAAWAADHALAHLGEHVGHAHLTRHLLRAG